MVSTRAADPAIAERRFLDGLAAAACVDRARLDASGTTVVGRDDRAGSAALACYRTASHLLVWGDPAVVDRAEGLASDVAVSPAELGGRLEAADFSFRTAVRCAVLSGPPTPPVPVPSGYDHRWLPGDDPATLPVVRSFTERCDPDDVAAAGLDELDEFAEDAVNVVSAVTAADASPPPVVAYASGAPWDWDPTFADIGVLVDGEHRRRGLAQLVVAHTVERLLGDGRLPLYRHEIDNAGSAAIALAVGFRPVAELAYYVSAS